MATRSKYNANVLTFLDSNTHERVLPVSPILYYNELLSAALETIPAAGSATAGAEFVKKIVGAGPPTVAQIKGAIGGQVAIALTATSEKQDAVLYWDDNLGLDVTKGLVWETRALVPVLPSVAGVQAVFGIAAAWIDGPDNNTAYLEFGLNGSGAVLCRSQDGVTQNSVASGMTVGTTDWHVYRIDATVLTDVGFYIDGVRQNANNSIAFAATGTLAVLQPYSGCYKASGTGVGSLTLDFVRAWMNRQ